MPSDFINTPALRPCPNCHEKVTAEVFPAILRSLQPGASPERVVLEDQASCFFHPQKKASIACEDCGRFLCALCDLDFNNRHVCPTCFETARNKVEANPLQNHRIVYDNVALGVSILPILAWPFTVLTAPAALVLSIYYWNKPGSILPRTKIRFILAIIFALAQMIGWGVFLFFMFNGKF